MKIILLGLVLIAAVLTANQPVLPAQADTPGCVTRHEYRRVDTSGSDAWTRRHVARVFDTRGHVVSIGSNQITLHYHTCAGVPALSFAAVIYRYHRAWFKFLHIVALRN